MHKHKRSFIDRKFGKLLVLEKTDEKLISKFGKKRNGIVYKCKCDCSNICLAHNADLLSGKKSCGCLPSGGHNKIDLIGKVFGKLTVIEQVPIPEKHKATKRTNAFWKCKCECGKETIIIGSSLRRGTLSCGCLSRLSPKNNLINKKFRLLLVTKRLQNTNKGLARWECRCDCGGTCIVLGTDLRQGRKKSCGCLTHKTDVEKYKTYKTIYIGFWNKIIRGAKKRNLEFNLSVQEGYQIYKKQGGRCNFSGVPLKFYSTGKTDKNENREDEASLDRIDSTKGYTIDNIQWITKQLNRLKMDTDNNIFIDLCREVAYHARKSNEQTIT